MIFITLGSQKFQFDRILKEVDKLIEEKSITEEVIAQIGYSTYIPKHYKYEKFMDREKFAEIMETCDKVITHGGTGAIITAVKKKKKVIAVPRLAKFEEHVDDHQLDIVNQFDEMHLIKGIRDVKELKGALEEIKNLSFKEYKSNTVNIMNSIEEYINNL